MGFLVGTFQDLADPLAGDAVLAGGFGGFDFASRDAAADFAVTSLSVGGCEGRSGTAVAWDGRPAGAGVGALVFLGEDDVDRRLADAVLFCRFLAGQFAGEHRASVDFGVAGVLWSRHHQSSCSGVGSGSIVFPGRKCAAGLGVRRPVVMVELVSKSAIAASPNGGGGGRKARPVLLDGGSPRDRAGWEENLRVVIRMTHAARHWKRGAALLHGGQVQRLLTRLTCRYPCPRNCCGIPGAVLNRQVYAGPLVNIEASNRGGRDALPTLPVMPDNPLNAVNRGVYISDNLPFLRGLNDGCIDLVCIDPPFAKNETFGRREK